MKKTNNIKYVLMATTMMALTGLTVGCAADDNDSEKQTALQTEEAIGFEAYLNRGTTRAYSTNNELTTAELQNNADGKYGKYGFGVFAYYTGKERYNQTAQPEFMYNQQVTYQNSLWQYSPLKYWPNGYGMTDGNKGKIPVYTSFFAYAPYSECDPYQDTFAGATLTNMCITDCTGTDEPGYPYVRYRIAPENPLENQVDLCYATPILNQQKPDVSSKLQFNFNHALASLVVTVDSRVNSTSTTGTVADDSRIYVRSVTFDGFATEGTLNLNSAAGKPTWYNYAGMGTVSKTPVVLNDCRRDGREAMTEDLGEATFVNACLLNPDIIQAGNTWDANPGVDGTTRNLFAAANATTPLFVIPNGDAVTVTITYDVETKDKDLIMGYLSDGTTHGSSIGNTITKTIKVSGDALKLVAGKKYTIALHLGMTSVDFEAAVSDDWDSTTPAADVYVPAN